jgi:hypothetical protein
MRPMGNDISRSSAFALVAALANTPAAGQSIFSAYTKFDSRRCRHIGGKDVEDYGTWRCPGYRGLGVFLSAGDQRVQVSFGRNAGLEPAASQTFPGFNSVYSGTVEWRIERLPSGKTRPFATVLRWNVMLPQDERVSTGRVLVVTRLGPSCHVRYVDGVANPNANELARQIADNHARTFKCGTDVAIVLGSTTPGLRLPKGTSTPLHRPSVQPCTVPAFEIRYGLRPHRDEDGQNPATHVGRLT